MKNINLDNFKVAIFDFDDTLAIHSDKEYLKHRSINEEAHLDYYLNAYLNQESFYDSIEKCDKSDSLYRLINDLRNKKIKLYCLTGTKFSFNIKAKENYVHKHYGDDIEIIWCYPQERKVDAVKIVKKLNNCELKEILFVDDMKDNINRLNNLGICALLIDELEY